MDVKAEMGSSCKAMIRSRISFDKVPNEQEQKDTFTNWRQKNDFAETAKKRNRKDKVAQRSLVAVEEKNSVSDSNEDAQPEFGGVAIVAKSQKRLSPRIINPHPQSAWMKCHDLDRIEQVKESEASLGSRESIYYVEAYLETDEICTNDLFSSPKIQ